MTHKLWYFWNFLPDMLKEIDKLSTEDIKRKYLNKIENALQQEQKEKLPIMLQRLKNVKAIKFVLMNEFLRDEFKEAFHNYINGLDLSCISLCGIIGENIVLDLFENAVIKINETALTNQQKREAFDYLNQELKIDLLLKLTVINQETAGKLQEIRKKRNNFVHQRQQIKANENDSQIIINLLTDILHNVYGQKYIPVDVFVKFIQQRKER